MGAEGVFCLSKDPVKKKKGRMKKLLCALAAVVLLAAGTIVLRGRVSGKVNVTYASYTAATGTISNSLSFSGSLQLLHSETITANARSTVREVYVREGQDVCKGEKLLRMSNGQIAEASFDGRVNQLYVAAGDEAAAGDSLIQLADFTHMKVAVNVDEYDIGDVSTGTECRITTTATEQTFASEIASINYISSAGGSVAYYTATAYVDVTDGVYPGMQVTMTIPQEEAENVVVLNMDALSFDAANQAYVLMQGADGTMQTVYVTTGVSNGSYVEITGGLQSGDVVYAVSKSSESSFGLNSLGALFNTSQPNEQRKQQNQQRMNSAPGGGSRNPGSGSGGGRP